MNIDIVLISTILIFIVTTFKTIFDLYINPSLHKKDIEKEKLKENTNFLLQGIKKRERGENTTTLVFFIISIATILIIGESIMKDNITAKDFQDIKIKVEKMEKILFPNDPGGNGPISLLKKVEILEEKYEEMEQKLIELESVVDKISIAYAKKVKGDIVKMKNDLNRSRKETRSIPGRQRALAK